MEEAQKHAYTQNSKESGDIQINSSLVLHLKDFIGTGRIWDEQKSSNTKKNMILPQFGVKRSVKATMKAELVQTINTD